MKSSIFLPAMLTAVATFAVPVAENTTFVQNAKHVVNITYTLTESPAIVTLDIQTNVTGDAWASIGTGNIVPGLSPNSEAYRKVNGTGSHTIQWRPYRSWPGDNLPAGKVRAIVTAWSLDNPPDYMVVDISTAAQPNTWRYYADADSVPGGVLGNETYRKTAFLMRKILAKDVTWIMGAIGENGRSANETTRTVTLTNDYYMAVFETTQEQWRQVMGDWPVSESKNNRGSYTFTNALYRAMRPAQNIAYNEIRTSGDYSTYNVGNDFPNPPHADSFLGRLRARTGIDFDLPGEAQWEYACRAGMGEGLWNDGTRVVIDEMPGRHNGNGGAFGVGDNYSCGPERGTAICGSYAPNSWGLYDMHGNMGEWCLDWFQESIPHGLDYRVNIDPADPSKRYDGTAPTSMQKTKRGGNYGYGYAYCRSASRNKDSSATQYFNIGCRVICPFERP